MMEKASRAITSARLLLDAGDVDGANLRRGRQILGAERRGRQHRQPRAGENRSGPEHSGDCDERDAVKVPGVEAEEPNLGRLDPQAHDGIEVAGIGELGAIACRWLGRRARMRMIEADDLEPPPACRPPRREMIGGVDQKPRRGLVGEVAGSDSLDNLFPAAQE